MKLLRWYRCARRGHREEVTFRHVPQSVPTDPFAWVVQPKRQCRCGRVRYPAADRTL